MIGIIPNRYKELNLSELDTYFAMARGYQGESGDVRDIYEDLVKLPFDGIGLQENCRVATASLLAILAKIFVIRSFFYKLNNRLTKNHF